MPDCKGLVQVSLLKVSDDRDVMTVVMSLTEAFCGAVEKILKYPEHSMCSDVRTEDRLGSCSTLTPCSATVNVLLPEKPEFDPETKVRRETRAYCRKLETALGYVPDSICDSLSVSYPVQAATCDAAPWLEKIGYPRDPVGKTCSVTLDYGTIEVKIVQAHAVLFAPVNNEPVGVQIVLSVDSQFSIHSRWATGLVCTVLPEPEDKERCWRAFIGPRDGLVPTLPVEKVRIKE